MSDIFNTYTISGNPSISTQTSGNVTYNVVGTAIVSGGTLQQTGTFFTGNTVNMSFYFDSIATGLDAAEMFCSKTFSITGYKLGCVTTGAAPQFGGIFSGRFYQRKDDNSKIILQNFSLNTGAYTYFSGGLQIPFTGLNRLGVDVQNTTSGLAKLSIGVFGY